MAGIGFDLRRLVAEEAPLLAKARGYASACLISAGPWLITMLGLASVGLTISKTSNASSEGFLGLMTWVFAFSLLVVSGLQMVFTRWLADTLYCGRYESIVPGFVVASSVVAGIQTPLGAGFCIVAGFEPGLAIVTTFLYVGISMTWIALVWLTVIRQYEQILVAFVVGIVAFWIALHALRPAAELTGTLAAYAIGVALTLTLMTGLIIRGAEPGSGSGTEVLGSLRRYPTLLAVGLLYGIGVWSDKLVFWFTVGTEAMPCVWSHPVYDSCFFLAYLSVVPALTINLVHLETSFYERYRGYYAAILGGFPLGVIEKRRAAMIAELRRGTIGLIRTQGVVTAICLLLAGWLVQELGMPAIAERVLRFALVGAFFQVLFLITLLVQLYFDLRREAFIASATFLCANACFAIWSVEAGPHAWGVGYAVGSLLALVVAFVQLGRALDRLTFRTFIRHAHPNLDA